MQAVLKFASYKDIAAQLSISVRTVKFHIGNVHLKFGVCRTVEIPHRILTKQGLTVTEGAIHAIEELSLHNKFNWKRDLRESRRGVEERLYRRLVERFGAHGSNSEHIEASNLTPMGSWTDNHGIALKKTERIQ